MWSWCGKGVGWPTSPWGVDGVCSRRGSIWATKPPVGPRLPPPGMVSLACFFGFRLDSDGAATCGQAGAG